MGAGGQSGQGRGQPCLDVGVSEAVALAWLLNSATGWVTCTVEVWRDARSIALLWSRASSWAGLNLVPGA